LGAGARRASAGFRFEAERLNDLVALDFFPIIFALLAFLDEPAALLAAGFAGFAAFLGRRRIKSGAGLAAKAWVKALSIAEVTSSIGAIPLTVCSTPCSR